RGGARSGTGVSLSSFGGAGRGCSRAKTKSFSFLLPLERTPPPRHSLLQFFCDLFRVCRRFEPDRLADAHLDCPRRSVMFLLDLEGKQPVNTHGNHRQVQLRGEKTDSAAERPHLSGLPAPAFGEDEHAEAFVCQLAGEAKAFPILGPLRQ